MIDEHRLTMSRAGSDRVRVLIVEDDLSLRSLLRECLQRKGYAVEEASSLEKAKEILDEQKIQMVITDLILPGADLGGYQLVRWIRSHPAQKQIPVLMTTVRADLKDKLEGFDAGVDDYVTKPFDTEEIMARVEALERRQAMATSNPLTFLPGTRLIEEMIHYILQSGQPWAALYVDINHFKSYNDVHGFSAGDEVIHTLSKAIEQVVEILGNRKDFVGHIGGDDFLILTTPDKARLLSEAVIQRFEERVPSFHTEEERETKILRAKDRQGNDQDFPLLSVAIGAVTSENRKFQNHLDLSKTLAESKEMAKRQKGSAYFLDRRIEVLPLNFSKRMKILAADDEASVREVIERSLKELDFEVVTAADGVEAMEKVRCEKPDLLLLDQLMPRKTGLEVLHDLRQDPLFRDLPVVMLTCMGGTDHIVQGLGKGADDYIVKPFLIPELQVRIKAVIMRSRKLVMNLEEKL